MAPKLLLILTFAFGFTAIHAQDASKRGEGSTNDTFLVDLPLVLRLAHAQNLDIQMAREKLAEAKANNQSATLQFFPWLSAGVVYRRHDGNIQSTEGDILNVSKQSYAPGGALVGKWDLGDAIYQKLASKQLENAASYALHAQRQDTAAAAARDYFDLAFAQAAVGVSAEAVAISTNYEAQLQGAVEVGLALKSDQLRATVQVERNRLALRQAIEQQRNAATRLAQTLHLDPSVELVARDVEPAPLSIVEKNTPLAILVNRALMSRPELKQSQALAQAARDARNGALYGPLIPSVGAEAFAGGLGGGRNGDTGSFGPQQDYFVGLGWRIGPGGLFDSSRQSGAKARFNSARIATEKIRDEITRQVVDAFTHLQSQADQINASSRALAAAAEALRLAQQRREFAVGVVLENILAEQDLTHTRNDYLMAVAEFNKSQYALLRATGLISAAETGTR